MNFNKVPALHQKHLRRRLLLLLAHRTGDAQSREEEE